MFIRRGLALVLEISPDLPQTFSGDSGRTKQILTNLIGNALKFTEQGSITVRVCLCEPGNHGSELLFEVIDTGVGISPQDQSFLFERFVQIDGSMTRRKEGTGLGLAICKQLVELMEGQIGCRSEPGKGSTFWFSLPPGLVKKSKSHAA